MGRWRSHREIPFGHEMPWHMSMRVGDERRRLGHEVSTLMMMMMVMRLRE